jgi:hypothetical protein
MDAIRSIASASLQAGLPGSSAVVNGAERLAQGAAPGSAVVSEDHIEVARAGGVVDLRR